MFFWAVALLPFQFKHFALVVSFLSSQSFSSDRLFPGEVMALYTDPILNGRLEVDLCTVENTDFISQALLMCFERRSVKVFWMLSAFIFHTECS